MLWIRSYLKHVLRILLLALTCLAGSVFAQSTQYTLGLGIASITPNPAPVDQPIHIVPIATPEGNTGGVLPTGSLNIGIYIDHTSYLEMVTDCDIALTSLSAGCDLQVAEPGLYEIMLIYPGDVNYRDSYSAKSKLHVYNNVAPPPNGGGNVSRVPGIGGLTEAALALLLGLSALSFVRRSA